MNLDQKTGEVLKRFETRNSNEKYKIGDLEFNKKSIDSLTELAENQLYAGKLKPHIKDVVELANKIKGGTFKKPEEVALAIAGYIGRYKDQPQLDINLRKVCADGCLGISEIEYIEDILQTRDKRLMDFKNYKSLRAGEDWHLQQNPDFPNIPYFINGMGYKYFPDSESFSVGGQRLNISDGWEMSVPKDTDYLNAEAAFINRRNSLYFYPGDSTYYNPETNEYYRDIKDVLKPQSPANLPVEPGTKNSTMSETIQNALENNAANLSNEEIGNLSYLLNSLLEAKGHKIEISKREWQLLQLVPYVYGRQTANNSEWAKDAAKFDEQEGLEEKNRIAVIDDRGILLSADYVEYIRSLFAKLTQKEIIEEQPDRLNDKISQKDIETLEAKLNEFKEIQTKGKLTNEQLDTFMALALLKKTGWDKATYGNVPTNLLSLTEYDKQPSVSHLTKGEKINIDRLTGEEVEEVKNIIVKLSQNEDKRHSRYVDDLSKIIDKINRREDFTTQEVDAARQIITDARMSLKIDIGPEPSEPKGEAIHRNPIEIAAGKAIDTMEKEVGIAREEIAAAVPAIQNVGGNTVQLALERLGVLGIPPEGVVPIRDEDIQVPEFLKIQNPTSTSWAERIFGKEASRSKVGGFVDKVRDWWGNKKWDRSTIETKSGTASEATTVVTAAGLILLALLGVNKLKEKGVDKPHTAEIIDREKPVSANPQTFDDVPNPYPPVFEGQTIYPEVPNVSVSEIGTDVLAQYTQVTPEMVRACQAGNNSYLINCIKAVAGSQAKELRTELVGIIGEAAKKRANSEGRDWSKLNANERNAYADAVLGGDKNSPAGKIAKKLGLDQKDYTFTGMDDLKKIGIKVALPEKPKLIPEDMVISEIKAMKI